MKISALNKFTLYNEAFYSKLLFNKILQACYPIRNNLVARILSKATDGKYLERELKKFLDD